MSNCSITSYQSHLITFPVVQLSLSRSFPLLQNRADFHLLFLHFCFPELMTADQCHCYPKFSSSNLPLAHLPFWPSQPRSWSSFLAQPQLHLRLPSGHTREPEDHEPIDVACSLLWQMHRCCCWISWKS